MITNYRQAWIDFRKSQEYIDCRMALKSAGIKQRYADSVLKIAFVAGWGDRDIIELKLKR